MAATPGPTQTCTSTPHGNQNLDEAIELRNVGAAPIDLADIGIIDRHPIADPEEVRFGMDWTIPATDLDGNASLLQPGEIALITLANPDDYPLAQANWESDAVLNYAVFPPGTRGFAPNGTPADEAFDDRGDGVWVFDADGGVVHYFSWNDDNLPERELGQPPIREHGMWDNLQQGDLARAPTGTSLSLATNGPGAFLAECWEETASGDVSDGDCLFGGEHTASDDPDTSGLVTKITSLGAPNVSAAIGPS